MHVFSLQTEIEVCIYWQTAETNQLRESVESLQQELQMSLLEAKANRSSRHFESLLVDNVEEIGGWLNTGGLSGELRNVEQNGSGNDRISRLTLNDGDNNYQHLQSQLNMQVFPSTSQFFMLYISSKFHMHPSMHRLKVSCADPIMLILTDPKS